LPLILVSVFFQGQSLPSELFNDLQQVLATKPPSGGFMFAHFDSRVTHSLPFNTNAFSARGYIFESCLFTGVPADYKHPEENKDITWVQKSNEKLSKYHAPVFYYNHVCEGEEQVQYKKKLGEEFRKID